MKLRDYQMEAVEALLDYWNSGEGSPLIVLPTGTGKSLVLARIAQMCLEYPDTKVLVVAHIRELIRQNADEMLALWPGAPIGIYSAGLGRRDTDAQIIFCSVQSIYRPRVFCKFGKVDVVLIDEAHLIPMIDAGMYRSLLNGLRIVNPHTQVVGLTATPFRLDSGRLDEGKDRFFHRVCYEYPIRKAIDAGYLSAPTSKPTHTTLDVKGVGTRGGEFIAGELEAKVNLVDVNESVVNETIAEAVKEGRKSWLFFCAGVDHATAICDIVNAKGYSCAVITGDTPTKQRDAIIEAFKAGEITALASVNVITTGFNAKRVDLIAMLRPTQSAGLYIQMVGRGTRLSPETGKVNCRVLDFAGNIYRFGPIDDVRIKKPGEGGGEAPFKICPICKETCATATRVCRACGHEFPPPVKELNHKASALSILSDKEVPPPEWVAVSEVSYKPHKKPDKPTSMKVTYQCGLSAHSVWICFEHGGYAAGKAIAWWTKNQGQNPPPRTTAEALARCGELAVPGEIQVAADGKYTRVVATRGVLDLRPARGAVVGVYNPEWDDIPF